MAEGEEQDESQKTEEPTERRLEKAHEEGQSIISKEVTNFFFALSFVLALLLLFPKIAFEISRNLRPFILQSGDLILDHGAISNFIFRQLGTILFYLTLPFSLFMIIGIAIGLLQSWRSISLKTLTPKINKISPLQGAKRIFSIKSVMDLLKGIIKISLISFSVYWGLKKHILSIESWIWLSLSGLKQTLLLLIKDSFYGILPVLFFLAIFDYYFQRKEFYKKVRMTKQEIKEEFKDTEGNPEIRQKIRKIRQERSQQRMMSGVPSATAIITNPTHYSIAILWNKETMNAPKVIAKGQDFLALKIREVAQRHKVPIFENPSLARAIYYRVEIDQEIPEEHYQAIAEIIKLVMKLKQRQF